jgi:uncharacterized membrane protein
MDAGSAVRRAGGTFALVVAASAAMIAYLTAKVAEMPERVPLHFDRSGDPDRWGEPSWIVFGFLPLLALGMGAFLCTLAGLVGSGRRTSTTGRTEHADGKGAFFTAMSRFLCWMALLTSGLLLAISYNMVETARGASRVWTWQFGVLIGGFLVGTVGGVIAILAKHGSRHMHWGEIPAGERRHWKLGVIYCNPEDPAIFVEHRFGMGLTANVGNPRTWLLLAGLAVVLGAPIVLLVVLT